jgi:hypothetical protein
MAPRRSKRPPKASTKGQAAQNDPSTSRSRTRAPPASPRYSPYPSPSRQAASAPQTQAEAQAEAQAETQAEPQPQARAEAQTQPPTVTIQPPTAQPAPTVAPLPIHGPPADQRIAYLERQLEALQQSLLAPPPPPSASYLQQPHYALRALPYAPVIPPHQGSIDLPRQSFLNTQGESQISESIIATFPYIKKRLIEDVWHNRLSLEGFGELASDPLPYLDTGELPKIRAMFRGLEVYGRIVCWFANKKVALDLHEAFSSYRLHLLSLLGTYTFESVQAFHHTFVRIRLPLKQDDPTAWTTRSEQIERICLVARSISAARPLISKNKILNIARAFYSWAPNICRA